MLESLLEKLLFPFTSVEALVHEGGPFVIWIFLCGFLMWTLVIERYWYFSRMLPRRSPRPWRPGGRAPSTTRGARARSAPR